MASRGGRCGSSSKATFSSSRLRLSLLGTRESSSEVFSDVRRDSSEVSLGSTGSLGGLLAARDRRYRVKGKTRVREALGVSGAAA
jgi:hypothetical protein